MKAPQKIVLPDEVMASSIVRLVAPFAGQSEGKDQVRLTGEFNFSERLTEKFSQRLRTKFELTDSGNLEGKLAFKILKRIAEETS